MANAIALSRRVNAGFAPFFGPGNLPGRSFYVSTSEGTDDATRNGLNPTRPLATIQAAIDLMESFDTLFVSPGEYDEEVTIPVALSNITIVGMGGRGAAFIAPSATNATALTNLADDVTIINLGLDGEGTGGGLVNYGSRLRLSGCKLEGGTTVCYLTLATVAQEAAGTHGVGADIWIDDCEFAWATEGIVFKCTDYGAVTQVHIRNCLFHNLSAESIGEEVGSGGAAGVMFRNVTVDNCRFDLLEDGTAPTKYIDLDGDNANSGTFHNCTFPVAVNGGKVLYSTKVVGSAMFFTGGIATTTPS